jgi:hypothetical protein
MANFSVLRRWIVTNFEDEKPRLFDMALALLIVVNVSGVILESVEPV